VQPPHPRHTSAAISRRRAVLLPTVLLFVGSASFAGLAALPAKTAPLSVTAAAADAALAPQMTVTAGARRPFVAGKKNLDLLDRVTAAPTAPAPARVPPRASRARRATSPPPPPPPPAPSYVRPGVGVFSSGFKWRWGAMHTGIDLAGPYGSPIRAVADGVVVEAGTESGYGNIVKIEHADGVVTYYAHLSRILVQGGPVEAGEVIAEEGNSGRSTGPHLHFEVRIGGTPVDPAPWLARHGISL
jgi:murein DD-endopeptidase MepM/ murein hydrolase activator NlpD